MAMAHQQQHQQQLKQAQQQQVFNSQAQSQQQQQASLLRQQHPQQPAPQQQPQQQQQQSQQQQTRAEAHSPQGPSQAALQLWQLWGNQDRTPQAGEVQVNTFRRLCDCMAASYSLSCCVSPTARSIFLLMSLAQLCILSNAMLAADAHSTARHQA